MHYSVLNRATLQVANTTAVSGRVTAKSVKHGFCAKKQSDLSRICALTIFGSVVSLAPMTARAQIPAEIAQLKAQVAALQSEVHVLPHELAAVQSNKALKLGPFVDVRPQPGKRGKRAKYQIRRRKFTARSGNLGDVQAAVNSAVDGDTVIIPNGTWTWTSTLDVTNGGAGKSINLFGQSQGGVTLMNSMTSTVFAQPLIELRLSKNFHAEIKWINFEEGTLAAGGMHPFIKATRSSSKVPLIHDCNFHSTHGFVKRFLDLPVPGGVIWNCNLHADALQGSQGFQVGVSSQDGEGFFTQSTMGTLDFDGMHNTYVEDCTFTNILYATDWSDGAKGVTRHCQFKNASVGTHGQDSAAWGMRHIEVYNCTWDPAHDPVEDAVASIRGATGVYFNNKFNGAGLLKFMCLQLTQQYQLTACKVVTYPIPRQVGQGWNGATPHWPDYNTWVANGKMGSYAYPELPSDGTGYVPDPCYVWGNDNDTVLVQNITGSGDQCGHGLLATNFIVKGRDYFEGTAKPGYVPYTYPHPLRGPQPPTFGTSPDYRDSRNH